jgi:hypothetical protein
LYFLDYLMWQIECPANVYDCQPDQIQNRQRRDLERRRAACRLPQLMDGEFLR